MTEQTTAGGLDMEALRRAAEGKDAEAMVGLYAVDAAFVRVDRNNTPSSPMTLRGREIPTASRVRCSGKGERRSTGRANTRPGQGFCRRQHFPA